MNNLKYTHREIQINTSGQSMYEITDNINSWLIKQKIKRGQLTIFVKHTSASLCAQENASKDVIDDIQDFFTKLVPDKLNLYRHNSEGKDDMPAHIKSALTNSHLTLSVKNSKIILGTWQGLYLFEHRLENQTRIISHHFIGDN